MSDIIPNYSLSQFKALTEAQLRRLKCCEIITDVEETPEGKYRCGKCAGYHEEDSKIGKSHLKFARILEGEYLFTFTNPRTDFIRANADFKGQLSNSVGGETIEEILKQEVAV